MMNPEDIARTGTVVALQSLTDQELAALYNAVTANFDPRRVMGYEKVSHLFTEVENPNGPPTMHQLVRQGLEAAVKQRIVSR
jgi:hypothetical protein